MKFGLSPETIAIVSEVLRRHPSVQQAILFGSRAKGTHHGGSDIDLALVGRDIPFETLLHIMHELDEAPIPYEVDVAIYDGITDKAVRDHIDRRGVVFYQRDTRSPVH